MCCRCDQLSNPVVDESDCPKFDQFLSKDRHEWSKKKFEAKFGKSVESVSVPSF